MTNKIVPSEMVVGKIGQRLNAVLKLDSVRGVKTRFGGFCRIYKFSDAHGRRFSWISEGGPNSWHEGHSFELRGTVKKHNQFRGRYETELSRVTIVRQVLGAECKGSTAGETEVPLNVAAQRSENSSLPASL